MNNTPIVNAARLVEQLFRFAFFVHQLDDSPEFISFRDSAGFLGREEDYKSRIAEESRKELNFSSWSESWIGTGKIAGCAERAMHRAGNLVYVNQQIDFKNRLDPNRDKKYRPEAERILYDIYRNPLCEESAAFANAVKVFGAKYDTIAFLFFIKDDTRFLPISPGHFEKGFISLGIDYHTSRRCGWENYQGFLGIIKKIRAVMEDILPMRGAPRLIDAHSFVWVIQQDRFMNWRPSVEQITQIERMTERYIQRMFSRSEVSGSGGRRAANSSLFNRSAEVAKETKRRANGICQYCGQPAPFLDRKGDPYLEAHHVIWLSRGGKDSTANTVALCPNCHARIHILDRPEDTAKLKEMVGSTL